MKNIVFILIFILFSFLGCSSVQLNREIVISDPTEYIFSTTDWVVSDSVILNRGLKKDTVIWIDKILNNNFRITFDVSVIDNTNNDLFELLFIIYGNKEIVDKNFWKDGYVVSYKSNNSKSSSIRINGIYDGAKWLIYKNNIESILQSEIMHVDLSVINNSLTLLINDKAMFNKFPLKKIISKEYFGIAQYRDSANKRIMVKNIKIYK